MFLSLESGTNVLFISKIARNMVYKSHVCLHIGVNSQNGYFQSNNEYLLGISLKCEIKYALTMRPYYEAYYIT